MDEGWCPAELSLMAPTHTPESGHPKLSPVPAQLARRLAHTAGHLRLEDTAGNLLKAHIK